MIANKAYRIQLTWIDDDAPWKTTYVARVPCVGEIIGGEFPGRVVKVVLSQFPNSDIMEKYIVADVYIEPVEI